MRRAMVHIPEIAMLPKPVEFRKRAIDEGGNAVVNLHSFYQKNDLSNSTQYECHSGFAVAGVAFKGTVVKLAK